MREIIVSKLRELESTENIRILHAVESGSRAWGFASPDSDYDVRFIYVRNKEYYLKLEKRRDVIELEINDELDISGWDLDKTLILLQKSNPTLYEWFNSPIQYIKTEFYDVIQPYLKEYFVSQKALYHYLNMAKTNYRTYLKEDMVIAKKYFYVLRPLLACEWIIDRNSPPPMLFSELADAELDIDMQPCIEQLLEIKMNSPEIRRIPRMEKVNDYLDSKIDAVADYLNSMSAQHKGSWDKLNQLFLSELNVNRKYTKEPCSSLQKML